MTSPVPEGSWLDGAFGCAIPALTVPVLTATVVVSTLAVRVVTGIVVLGVGQTVVCLLDAQVLPGFGVGREHEAGIAQQRVGDELRGHLPAFRGPLAPAG